MTVHARLAKPSMSTTRAAAALPRRSVAPAVHSTTVAPTGLLALPRAIGNRAVRTLLDRRSHQHDAPQVQLACAAHHGAPDRDAQVHAAAAAGISGPGGPLPHLEQIQRAFGDHDVTHVRAHVDGAAAQASRAIGAMAFTTGDHVAFAGAPSLHTAAHEAAHVVQQAGGVRLAGGVGRTGDRHERHADAVADRVVARQSVEALLAEYQAPPASTAESAVQAKCTCGTGSTTPCTACADDAERHAQHGSAVQRKDGDAKPRPTCPTGATHFPRASWFHCDEGGRGTRELGCSVCSDTGAREDRCTTITAAIGTRIVAPNIGSCGDEFEISAAGDKTSVKVVKAEIPGGDTELDIHTDVIAALGLSAERGRYDVCLRPLGSKDSRVVRSGDSKCTPPAGGNPKAKP